MKTYVYSLPTMIALIAFIQVYIGFSSEHAAELTAIQEARAAKVDRQRKEQEMAMKTAWERAEADVKVRRERKEAEDARKASVAAEIERLLTEQRNAKNQSIEATDKVENLRTDVEALRREVNLLVSDKESVEKEQAHLQGLVKLAQANTTMLDDNLAKIYDARIAWHQRAALEQQRQEAARRR